MKIKVMSLEKILNLPRAYTIPVYINDVWFSDTNDGSWATDVHVRIDNPNIFDKEYEVYAHVRYYTANWASNYPLHFPKIICEVI